MQFSTIFNLAVVALAAQAEARAVKHYKARQLPGLGSLGGLTGSLGGVTGGLPGVGSLPGLGGSPAAGSTPPVTTPGAAPGSTAGSGNTFYCCSTSPGENPSLAAIIANVQCPQIPVINIVDFFNQCNSDNHRVMCNPSQNGESNNGLANGACTLNLPIQVQ